MTADGFEFLSWFFPSIWQFFTSWKVPGTNVTPASWFMFIIVAGIVLVFISKYLGVGWFNGK